MISWEMHFDARRTSAWRVWLGVFPENLRARRAYEAVGFQAEGVARGAVSLYVAHYNVLPGSRNPAHHPRRHRRCRSCLVDLASF